MEPDWDFQVGLSKGPRPNAFTMSIHPRGLRRLLQPCVGRRQSGVTSVEYALLAALISLTLVVGVAATGDANADFIEVVKDAALKIMKGALAALGA